MSKIYESFEEFVKDDLSRFECPSCDHLSLSRIEEIFDSRQPEIDQLKKELEAERAKVEKMKCCENCAHWHISDIDRDAWCALTAITCMNNNKWKLRE